MRSCGREVVHRGIILRNIFCASAKAQQGDQKFFSEMRWRCIGPFRGGRTVAISGVPHQPNVFYMAAVNGGVWKTTDFRNTWNPIFDDQPTGSIGALAVALRPNIILRRQRRRIAAPGSCDGDASTNPPTPENPGRICKTSATLNKSPRFSSTRNDPNRVFVAAEGHPYGPNAEAARFRSTDGWSILQKVLYKDENIGAADPLLIPQIRNNLRRIVGRACCAMGDSQRRILHQRR